MDWDQLLKKQEKLLLGTTMEMAAQVPSLDATLDLTWDLATSPIPPRILGTSSNGGLTTYSDSDRKDHFHILGAPDQGKSKLLEMMMSEDILYLQDSKIPFDSGFCFLDSTGNGATAKKVLKFACQQGFEKILYIDPHLISKSKFGHVVNINPIDYAAPAEAIAGHLMNTVRVLWSTKDPMDEGIIRKYAPRVFRALHAAGMTLPDSECFTIPELARQRDQILSSPKLDFPTRVILERALKSAADWRDFQSTCRRLDPFFTDTLKLMFGAVRGINFQELMKKGWCIICNLYPGGVFLEEHQKLLGTV